MYFWGSIPIYFVSDADAFRVINGERVFQKDVESVSDLLQGVATRDILIEWKVRANQRLWKEYHLDSGEGVEKA